MKRARTLASSPPHPPPPHRPPLAGEPPPSSPPPAPPPPRVASRTWQTTAPCQGRAGRPPQQASTRFSSFCGLSLYFAVFNPLLFL